ncbi:MAG: alpha-amylase [Cellulomonas sp. 73-145]|uniref:alpha-amylase family glycosyl hydrolase n=1 Tax=Cellulomonas sp. 73-145 TaxID=1895739 RepID=UPI00092CC8B2|nr:alpha-amylase family glycosyl hydrolase [Cellulomonas sp. 73-145]OJV57361.1 MAG: alpha-amylase [Cellulomonas sp. 73-145]
MSGTKTRKNRLRALASVAALAIAASAMASTSASAYVAPGSPGNLAEGDVIYQVLVDRFSNGDTSNDNFGYGEYDPNNLGMYHGGDWKGLTNHLQYVKDLGVTAIWISPVSQQQPLSRDGTEASYHGYFTHDFATPNEHFGSKTDLQNLVNTAHSMGLKMILDVVPNHTADYLAGTSTTYSPTTYAPAAPLNDSSLFHHNGDCAFDGSMNQSQLETCDLGGLDDLDQSNATVDSYLKNTYKDWVQGVGFDGVRVDAARSIPQTWLNSFQQAIGVPSFGEVFDGNVDYVSSYQNYEWGVLDFPYFFTARDAIAGDGDLNNLSNLFAQDYKYVNANRLETFLDNHDRARFLARAGDNYQRLREGLTFLMTSRGVPVIYYGTEQADNGNMNANEVPIANKDNRKDLSSFSETGSIYVHIKRLNEIKKAYPSLQVGTQREMWKDTNVYAFSRRVDSTGAETISAISDSWDAQTRTIPLRAESTIAVGTVLTNLMNTNESVTVQSGGVTGKQITVTLGEHDAKVFAPGAPVSTYTPPARTLTTIRVHYNVGYGNSVSIRGDTNPFSWTQGIAARNTATDVWEFQLERIPAGQSFQFKPLINDTTWSAGNNYIGTGGQTMDIYPTF